MSKHNYSQYSKRENKPKQTVTNAEPAEVKMEFDRADEEVVLMGPIEAVDQPAEPTTLPQTISGIVTNCSKLNVRSKPSITGAVLCVLNASSEIEINLEKSVTDWVYVCTATGVEGYCMRQFIKADM